MCPEESSRIFSGFRSLKTICETSSPVETHSRIDWRSSLLPLDVTQSCYLQISPQLLPVDNADRVKVVQCQGQFSQVEFDILLWRTNILHPISYHVLLSLPFGIICITISFQLYLWTLPPWRDVTIKVYFKRQALIISVLPVNITSFERRVKRSPPRKKSKIRYNLPSVCQVK